jgi:hypothetical protein
LDAIHSQQDYPLLDAHCSIIAVCIRVALEVLDRKMDDGHQYFQDILKSLESLSCLQGKEADKASVKQQIFMNDKFLLEQYASEKLDVKNGYMLHILAKFQTRDNLNELFGKLLIQYPNAYQLDGERREWKPKDFIMPVTNAEGVVEDVRIDFCNCRTPAKHRLHWWMFLREIQFLLDSLLGGAEDPSGHGDRLFGHVVEQKIIKMLDEADQQELWNDAQIEDELTPTSDASTALPPPSSDPPSDDALLPAPQSGPKPEACAAEKDSTSFPWWIFRNEADLKRTLVHYSIIYCFPFLFQRVVESGTSICDSVDLGIPADFDQIKRSQAAAIAAAAAQSKEGASTQPTNAVTNEEDNSMQQALPGTIDTDEPNVFSRELASLLDASDAFGRTARSFLGRPKQSRRQCGGKMKEYVQTWKSLMSKLSTGMSSDDLQQFSDYRKLVRWHGDGFMEGESRRKKNLKVASSQRQSNSVAFAQHNVEGLVDRDQQQRAENLGMGDLKMLASSSQEKQAMGHSMGHQTPPDRIFRQGSFEAPGSSSSIGSAG